MDEAKLREKLSKIEALFAGASTEGERIAAGEARRRIQQRLASVEKLDRPVEFRFSIPDNWSRKLFLSLLRRYDLKPYRYRGQRRTTVMVKMPKPFVQDTLWPEYQQINNALRSYLEEVTDRVIAEVLQSDSAEATELAEPAKLGSGGAVDIE
jgi:hypothetical protein